jgi:polyphosphate kinase
MAEGNPRKIWKLTDMDLRSYRRWYDCSRASDDMFAASDTEFAPWYVVNTDDKKCARLNIISRLFGQVPVRAARASRGCTAEAAQGRELP